MDNVYLVVGHSSGGLCVFFENVGSSGLKFKRPGIVGFMYIIARVLIDLIQIEF